MSNSGTSTKDLRLKPDGYAEDPVAFLKYIRADSVLMNKLLQIDSELHEVVLGNKINTLQQLLAKRHTRCHCRYVSRFRLFLEHLRGKHDPSSSRKLRKEEDEWIGSPGSPDFTGVYGHGRIFYESEVMIYVEIEVNGFPVKADIRTGSSTLISKRMAQSCGLLNDGGQLKVLGPVQCSDIKIGNGLYEFSLPVLDSADFEFVFGLDMLTELQCIADLKRRVLKVGDEEITIHLEEEANYILEHPNKKSSSGTAPQLYTETEGFSAAAASASGMSRNDLRLKSDGSAVDPAAFLRCIQEDSELMAEIFQIPKLVNAVGENDINQLQGVLRNLSCGCSHCVDLFLLQQFEELKRFNNNEAVRKHIPNMQAPYVLVKVGYGLPFEVLVDSGAKSTIMSKSLAEKCGLLEGFLECYEHLDDEGRSKIIGRVECSFIKIDKEFYRCPFFIMDSTDEFFVLGLDVLCDLQCTLDFKKNAIEVDDGVKAPIVSRQEVELCMRPPKRPRQDFSSVIDEEDAKEVKIKILMHYIRVKREEALDALVRAKWVLKGAVDIFFPDPCANPSEVEMES